ncbi:MAG: hypothetical protein O3A78_08445 [Nitrospinae bacterium]|jgi:hypothetical protein|nr:hypothetical protein [Nitrospinota bacterium]MDA1109829.1 hypothetical protein [Nitrospinota bacterium]
MSKLICSLLVVFFLTGMPSSPALVSAASSCDTSITTICTIEIWLGHNQKKRKKELQGTLESKSIKVLRNTIQYWKPKGGHPPTNIALGSGLSAEDARRAIDLALEYNDEINGLIHQRLNPPNYVAIATSAWDDKSETPITPDQLAALRDSKLTTEEFHRLYRELTQEATVEQKFY